MGIGGTAEEIGGKDWKGKKIEDRKGEMIGKGREQKIGKERTKDEKN